ncbi:hypothetical protein GJV03_04670 [Acinetobacter sp. RIT698]|jgi:predicted Zn-dependent protease with MMP-like domain|uniref:hypothetical protein n=1 Tax=Acinetobacter TaxID=469 RepID=UPI000CFF853B|nr:MULTISPECIES: hypothetical protein [Acinetobacter]MDN5416110.1 hypothetical protein [Acinetobacter sp.]MCS4299669.1 putative Zn-dependent protease with MMP-like domain [Acinetobacter guillouiae]MCW2253004.1 putative Zn-dependent protease with MMP-like domain [Acinetobacter sp. BIGb0204]MDN5489510.1 hypothetical protein [Acinetobacter sp.]MDN5622255.1 hypothetical protein [Acinetobacter sp.]
MTKNIEKSAIDKISTRELQHLITVSTGFIDAYIIDCYDKAPMLLPQNVVLSAQNSPTYVNVVEWHEKKLPTFSVSDPKKTLGVALIIEGEDADERFALMCNEMPSSIRLRISEVVDAEDSIKDKTILQYVKIGDKTYHVPDLDQIQLQIGIKKA